MKYKTGQAVICTHKDSLVFFKEKSLLDEKKSWATDLQGNSLKWTIKRPATEAEILAEIQKHGWELADIEFLTGKHINLIKTNHKGWVYAGGSSISTENIKELSNEGLQADRIITALNLAL